MMAGDLRAVVMKRVLPLSFAFVVFHIIFIGATMVVVALN
jgi:hypothetical protein